MAKTAKKQANARGDAAKRRVPMRMCVSCREMRPKANLLRVVKSPENVISIDKTGKMPGRGAYVCKNSDCIDKAQKHKMLARAFDLHVEPDLFNAIRVIIAEEGAASE